MAWIYWKKIFKDVFIFPTWSFMLLLDMKSTKALYNKKLNDFMCSSITSLKKAIQINSLQIYSGQL